MSLSRREFVKRSLVAEAGVAAAAALPCATAFAEEAAAEEAVEPSRGLDCDICIVGAGFSGLIAAIQATEEGAHVIVIEASNVTGGGAIGGVEGSFGASSTLAKSLGIELDIKEILASEMEQSQWRADGLAWMEMMENSGDNIDWLVEQGVKFSTVDDYHGKDFASFHWYEGGCGEGFITPMTAKLNELGIQVEYLTKAFKLVTDEEGGVTGVLARDEAKEVLQVNAKAVILATGGFTANFELCSHIGYDADRIQCVGTPYDDGSGHLMALEVGAKDMSDYAADNCGSIIKSFGFNMTNLGFCMAPQFPWINENCERFYKEDNCTVNLSLANPPKWNQARSYLIWDTSIFNEFAGLDNSAILNETIAESGSIVELLQKGLEAGEGDLFKADSIAELAELAELDPVALQEFIDGYNAMCEKGVDEIWSKDPQYMKPLNTPPYYIARPIVAMFTTIGGTATNRNSQVVDKNRLPIRGLYACGVEGCMLYRNVYTIGTPGSCSGNSINTARVAAKHAVANCL